MSDGFAEAMYDCAEWCCFVIVGWSDLPAGISTAMIDVVFIEEGG